MRAGEVMQAAARCVALIIIAIDAAAHKTIVSALPCRHQGSGFDFCVDPRAVLTAGRVTHIRFEGCISR